MTMPASSLSQMMWAETREEISSLRAERASYDARGRRMVLSFWTSLELGVWVRKSVNIKILNTFKEIKTEINFEFPCVVILISSYTVGLNMYKTLKKCSNKPNIFLIPLSISELTTSQNFFVTVWPPGGAIITFAENWNFELKFFLVNSFREKMTSR